MTAALSPERRLDLLGHVGEALDQVRAVLEAVPEVGAVRARAYRAMTALRELHDAIEAVPVERNASA